MAINWLIFDWFQIRSEKEIFRSKEITQGMNSQRIYVSIKSAKYICFVFSLVLKSSLVYVRSEVAYSVFH